MDKSVSISSFTYCDKVQELLTPNGPVSQIIRPLQELSPIAIPSNYSFFISCIISNIRYNPENHLKITFEDPGGEIIEVFEQHDCNPPTKSSNPDELYGLQLNIDIRNVILSKAGTYGTRVLFNNIELGFYKINVKQVLKAE